MSRKQYLISIAFFLLLLLGARYFFSQSENPTGDTSSGAAENGDPSTSSDGTADDTSVESPSSATEGEGSITTEHIAAPSPTLKTGPLKKVIPQKKQVPAAAQGSADAVHFNMEDGLAVMEGDILLGVPADPSVKTGMAKTPSIEIWDSVEIPFHIQADLSQPDRVLKAMQLFQNTAIRFVPYTGQRDAIVFEEKAGTCRSYLGKVGGLQPIFLSPKCAPADIAHEIMHALGFIHEQNRSDRDGFVEIHWDNIDPMFAYNFELLPSTMMKVTGTGIFDYESLMLYPPKMFAKDPSKPAMSSKSTVPILPGQGLSQHDMGRIFEAYVVR